MLSSQPLGHPGLIRLWRSAQSLTHLGQPLRPLTPAVLQSCHDMVPPDTLAPVLRQLVDTFVHDRARPEVMTLGLRTVRELCARCPLIMTPELLQVRCFCRSYGPNAKACECSHKTCLCSQERRLLTPKFCIRCNGW